MLSLFSNMANCRVDVDDCKERGLKSEHRKTISETREEKNACQETGCGRTLLQLKIVLKGTGTQ